MLCDTKTSLQSIVAGMLRTGLVDEVMAFVRESESSGIRVGFLRKEAEVDRIMTASYNPRSLAKLLMKHDYRGKKLGVVARSCDMRAIIKLAKRNQIRLDNAYLIGMVCYGTVSTREHKEADLYIMPDTVQVNGVKHNWDEASIRPNCLRCEHPIPTMADISCTVGDSHCSVAAYSSKGAQILVTAGISAMESQKKEMAEIQNRLAKRAKAYQERDFSDLLAMKPRERLEYWLAHYLSRCTGCGACRTSCPMCHCKNCLQENETWVKLGNVPLDNMYHLLRLMHVAPYCVNCGQCDNICPKGIPISKLYHMTYKELSTTIQYGAVIDVDDLTPPTPSDVQVKEGE